MATRAPSLRSCGCIMRTGNACAHIKASVQARDQQRPTARQRGYDGEYERAARAYLAEHRTCTCGAPAVLVRHRISIRLRPDLRMDRANWLPGCRSCNAKDAVRERRETGGYLKTSAAGGGTVWGQQRSIHPKFSSLGKGQIS